MIDEAEVQCPYCWQTVGLEVDRSAGDATLTQDCPVCCQPIELTVRFYPGGGYSVEVRREND